MCKELIFAPLWLLSLQKWTHSALLLVQIVTLCSNKDWEQKEDSSRAGLLLSNVSGCVIYDPGKVLPPQKCMAAEVGFYSLWLQATYVASEGKYRSGDRIQTSAFLINANKKFVYFRSVHPWTGLVLLHVTSNFLNSLLQYCTVYP